MLIIAAVLFLIMGLYLSFGPLHVNPKKLRPGQTPEDAIRKTRNMGYSLIAFSVVLGLIIYFVLSPMASKLY